MTDEQMKLDKLEVDKNNLYREDVFTDLRVASIRRLTPVKADGSPDPARETLFSAETQILTPQGPLPIQVPIEANSLEEALEKFPNAVHQGVERLVDEAREVRRQQSSRIVTPAEAGLGSKIILDR
jgi:hypothetical protein